MSVNTLDFEQSAAFLMDMYEEATGKNVSVQVVDTATFTSVATTLLQLGYDPIINAISQVLNKSIYSINNWVVPELEESGRHARKCGGTHYLNGYVFTSSLLVHIH